MISAPVSARENELLQIVRKRGVLRARDLSDASPTGPSPTRQTLRRLTERGLLISVGRGLYTLAQTDVTEHQSLIEVARRVPHGVICLLSALRFHEIGTQEPARVWLCIEGHARTPKIDGVRLEIVRQSGAAWTSGVQTFELRVGTAFVPVRITSPAKTVTDCWKFRSRVGLDVALEALRDALRSKKVTPNELWEMAQANRVTSVMRPYLEAMMTP